MSIENWIREHDLPKYASLGIVPGDVVLDIGGHTGVFAEWALEQGAARVVSAEPDSVNAAGYRKRLSVHAAHSLLLEAAVVQDRGEDTILYLHRGTNTGRHSTYVSEGRNGVAVAAITFPQLLQLDAFTVVKCDCEGAELTFDWREVPSSVRAIAIEFHKLHEYIVRMDHAVSELILRGFTTVFSEAPDSHNAALWVGRRLQ